MAKAKKRANSGGAKRSPGHRRAAKQPDAIGLLTADHRQVAEWFEQFESTRSGDRKQRLADQLCQALRIHTQIEEEIFYPAFLEATDDEDIHHEAEIEHEGAKRLIADIEAVGPDDEYYDARVTVLAEMIKHHVKEEEKRDGMFSRARKADMDLVGLGRQLQARKAELTSTSAGNGKSGVRRSRGSEARARA
jgi:Hemerythrin HHE cation binding domain